MWKHTQKLSGIKYYFIKHFHIREHNFIYSSKYKYNTIVRGKTEIDNRINQITMLIASHLWQEPQQNKDKKQFLFKFWLDYHHVIKSLNAQKI
jgi:hypothetical protein